MTIFKARTRMRFVKSVIRRDQTIFLWPKMWSGLAVTSVISGIISYVLDSIAQLKLKTKSLFVVKVNKVSMRVAQMELMQLLISE